MDGSLTNKELSVILNVPSGDGVSVFSNIVGGIEPPNYGLADITLSI